MRKTAKLVCCSEQQLKAGRDKSKLTHGVTARMCGDGILTGIFLLFIAGAVLALALVPVIGFVRRWKGI
jgi:hypothetical protein